MTPLIPLGIAAFQAGSQLFQAQKQKKEARKAETYVPPALLEEENAARLNAGTTRYAGQDQDEAALKQGTADAFANVQRATTSSGDILNAASKLDAAQSRGLQAISRNNQVFRQNAMDRLRGVMARKAGAQMQSRMYAENLRGAAAQNNYNAVNSMAGGVVQAGMTNDWNKTFGSNSNPSMMGSMMGGGLGQYPMSTYGWNPNAFSAGGNFFKQ